MPIKKIMLEDKTFGNIKFLQHVRTLNKRGTQEAEYEIYEMASSVYGSIQVYISSKVTKVKPKYLRQVELIKPYVIPRSNVMTIDNKKRANVEYTLYADEFLVIGGTN